MNILITGGAGFIGSHLVEHLLRTTAHQIVVVDPAPLVRLRDMDCWKDEGHRVHDVPYPPGKGPLRWRGPLVLSGPPVDQIVHLAAQSHVDMSIQFPVDTIDNNVMSTVRTLELARCHPVTKFLYFSTDEVFGPAPPGVAYGAWDRYKSGNPYAASKAAGEEIAVAYHNTYGVPVVISHCMNVFGERQHVEKFVPLVIKKVLHDEEVLIHADPTGTIPGSRFYLHARNVASAIMTLMERGAIGEKYNIVGEREVDNLALAQQIAAIMGRPLRYRLVDFHSRRPGHDLRYALDGSALDALGWTPPRSFDEGLRKTVEWTVAHPQWLDEKVGTV